MTTAELLTGGGGALLVAMTLIQISPLKINPWSALAKAVGRAINGEVISKVDKLGQDLQTVRHEAVEQAAINYRARILRFGDEIMHDVRHSKDHFDQTLHDITEYERYCKANPDFENNMTALTAARIKKIYSQCLEENDFL
ncbi:MAG: hypothetical protein RR350_03060 [Oscillibacter sp.]